MYLSIILSIYRPIYRYIYIYIYICIFIRLRLLMTIYIFIYTYMSKRSMHRQNVLNFICFCGQTSLVELYFYWNSVSNIHELFYERKAQEIELNCLEIHRVFEVAYFALAANWLLCDSSFSVLFQYLRSVNKTNI